MYQKISSKEIDSYGTCQLQMVDRSQVCRKSRCSNSESYLLRLNDKPLHLKVNDPSPLLFSRPARHALLQLTGKPVESKGPMSAAGPSSQKSVQPGLTLERELQFGPRSTGQSATPQPALLSIRTGRLYPSTKLTS